MGFQKEYISDWYFILMNNGHIEESFGDIQCLPLFPVLDRQVAS